MKRTGVLCAALTLVILPACASTGPSRYSESRNVVDSEKMALIDQISLRRGVQTTWVNPPVKRVLLAETRSD